MPTPASGWRRLIGLSLVAVCVSGPAPVAEGTAQDARAPSPQHHGAISGVISEGGTGQPVRGASVSLSDQRVGVSISTLTDSKGRFVFTDLPPSSGYGFDVRKPGYAGAGLAASPITSSAHRLRLAADQWIRHADVVLWRLGGISGRVVDEKGEPVVNVRVQALTRIAMAGTRHWASSSRTLTDDRGSYRIPNLLSGTYLIQLPNVQPAVPPSTSPVALAAMFPAHVTNGARVPPPTGLRLGSSWLQLGYYAIPPPLNGVVRAYPAVFYPGTPEAATAVPIDLDDGEERLNIDFVLHPVPTARVSGRVIGPAGMLAGVTVRLLPGDGAIQNPGTEQATALVADDGRFEFVGVPAGDYTLDTRSGIAEFSLSPGSPGAMTPATPGLVGASFSTLLLREQVVLFQTRGKQDAAASPARLPVSVGRDDVSNLTIELLPGGTISGRVVTDDGAPARVRVRAEPANGDPALGGQGFDLSSAPPPDGTFAVTGLLEGEYLLRISGAGIVKSITADRDYTNRAFAAKPGTDIENVLITMTDRPATLSGVVRNATGAAVEQATVVVFPADQAQWSHFGLEPVRITSVIALGQGYQVDRLPAGDYLVIAVDRSMRETWTDPRFFAAAAPHATRVTLIWGTPLVQDLTVRTVTLR